MKKFLIEVEHLADYNGAGYEYFVLKADNLTEAKNRTLVNFHKFKKTYLIKILATIKNDEFRPICNIYGDGRVENIKDEFRQIWQFCHNTEHDFEAYINNN